MTEDEKQKIINTFNEAMNRKIANESTYGKLASKEMFDNKEEIIIDGVDVAGCCFYNNGKCDNPNGMACNCINNAVCYFKELKRLEQENEQMKEKNATLEDKLQLRMASDKESDAFWDEIFSEKDYPFNKENAYKELKDYYFVLEQLPKIYMEITGGTLSKTTYFASSVVEAYNDSLNRYYEKIDDLEYNNNAYRSALEEIRILATKNVSIENFVKIQNKINEVLK